MTKNFKNKGRKLRRQQEGITAGGQCGNRLSLQRGGYNVLYMRDERGRRAAVNFRRAVSSAPRRTHPRPILLPDIAAMDFCASQFPWPEVRRSARGSEWVVGGALRSGAPISRRPRRRRGGRLEVIEPASMTPMREEKGPPALTRAGSGAQFNPAA